MALRMKLCCGLQAVNALGHVPVRMPEADMKLTIPLFSLKVGEESAFSHSFTF